MRIGTSLALVELDRQMPNRNQRECRYWWDELFQWINAAGFERVELPYQPKWDFGGRSGIPLSMRSVTIKDGSVAGFLARLHGHGISGVSGVHLDPSLFFSKDLNRYFGAFEHFAMEALDFAAQADAGTLILTATPCVGDLRAACGADAGRTQGSSVEGISEEADAAAGANDVVRTEDVAGTDDTAFKAWSAGFLDRTAALFNRMQTAAAARGVRLCLKNECWGLLAGEAVIPFLGKLHADVRLDLDTAHLQIAGVDPADFLRSHAGRVGFVHLTDTRHRMNPGEEPGWIPEYPRLAATAMFRDVGTGDVDFESVMEALRETGTDGDVILDSRHATDGCRALLRMRRFAILHAVMPGSGKNSSTKQSVATPALQREGA